jgi:RNA polymerase sigma factor (sigma-70 family)
LKESELVRKCQKGKSDAQQALYESFADKLYRLAYRYCKQEADAEDVVIIAFQKIFQNLKTFIHQGDGSLEAWMRRVVVNEALMWLRKNHTFHLTETLEENHPVPDLDAFRDVESEYLYQLIIELPIGYRTVFNLFVIEGYDHREIGELLNISENTSRSQLFKAKALLKKKLQQEGMHYGT